MIFKLIYEENGNYIDSNGDNCSLLIGTNFIATPDGLNVGCLEFDTVEQAETYYKITLIEIPEDEI